MKTKKIMVLTLLLAGWVGNFLHAQFQFTERDFYYSQPTTERQLYSNDPMDMSKGEPDNEVPEGWGSGYWTPVDDPIAQTGGAHRSKDGHWSRLGFGDGSQTGKGTWCWAEEKYGWYQDNRGKWKYGWHWVWYHQTWEFHPPVDADLVDLLIIAFSAILIIMISKTK